MYAGARLQWAVCGVQVCMCCMLVLYMLRQLILLRKSDCLRCAVLLCLVVCSTLLASFFLPSHLIQMCMCMCTCKWEGGVLGSTVELRCVDTGNILTVYTHTM